MTGTRDVAQWLREARVRVSTDGPGTVVRLRGFSPAMAFAATVAIAIVLCSFAYPLVAMAYNPNTIPALLFYGAGVLVVVVAVSVSVRRRTRIQSGYEDLIIDDSQRTVSLPRTFGRDVETLVHFDRITEVAPAEDVSKNRDILDAESFGPRAYNKKRAYPGQDVRKVGHRSEMQYVVLVCWQDKSGRPIESPIVKWSTQHRARSLTFWLRDRLGLEHPS